ncbi:MAG TPA: YetF domain-containing protein, partial [Metabacillus sp.]|nr:YetF domain-containing protein [Metabacillus sp.]
MEFPEVMLRISLSFVVLFILTRIMGRKEISQMTFFNFVSAIAIGSIAANLAVNSILSIRNGILALCGWTAFTLIMEFIDIKFKKVRKITLGEPIIVIKDGEIMENSLRSTQLDMDSLNTLLRQKGVFSVKEAQLAIFET